MHVGAPTTSAAAGMAERAARAGVDAVCALPGSFYGAGEDEAIGYYQAIGKLPPGCLCSSTTCPTPRAWSSPPS